MKALRLALPFILLAANGVGVGVGISLLFVATTKGLACIVAYGLGGAICVYWLESITRKGIR